MYKYTEKRKEEKITGQFPLEGNRVNNKVLWLTQKTALKKRKLHIHHLHLLQPDTNPATMNMKLTTQLRTMILYIYTKSYQ